jgi:hypothetical protein
VTIPLRVFRSIVSILIVSLAFTGFCATSGASRLADLQKLLTKMIEGQA